MLQALSVELREMRDHSRQSTAARIFFFFFLHTKPARNQHEDNGHTQPNIHNEHGPQRKQANGAIEPFL